MNDLAGLPDRTFLDHLKDWFSGRGGHSGKKQRDSAGTRIESRSQRAVRNAAPLRKVSWGSIGQVVE